MATEEFYRATCDNCGDNLSHCGVEEFGDYLRLKELMAEHGWVEDEKGLWCNECNDLPFEDDEE